MRFSSHTAVLASAYLLLAAHSFGQASGNNSSNALNFYVTTPQTGETRSVNASAQTAASSFSASNPSAGNYYITQTAQQHTAATAQTSSQPSRRATSSRATSSRAASSRAASSNSRQAAYSVQQVSNPAAQTSVRQATASNYYANTQTAASYQQQQAQAAATASPQAKRGSAATSQQANYYYYQQQTTNPAYVSNASQDKSGFFKRMLHNHTGSNSGVAIDQVSNAASRVKSVVMYPASKLNGSIQQGMASWYGTDFDGGPTASGETYDMDSMTAAHKSLPFGTMVKVKNERNGHECVVRINNRGPYSKGRIIDLSKAAARQLGMIGSGVAKVKMEVVGKT